MGNHRRPTTRNKGAYFNDLGHCSNKSNLYAHKKLIEKKMMRDAQVGDRNAKLRANFNDLGCCSIRQVFPL